MMETKNLSKSEYENIASVLERISKTYSVESEEHKAIEIAATALMFVRMDECESRWKTFLLHFHDKLSESQVKHLKSLGLID